MYRENDRIRLSCSSSTHLKLGQQVDGDGLTVRRHGFSPRCRGSCCSTLFGFRTSHPRLGLRSLKLSREVILAFAPFRCSAVADIAAVAAVVGIVVVAVGIAIAVVGIVVVAAVGIAIVVVGIVAVDIVVVAGIVVADRVGGTEDHIVVVESTDVDVAGSDMVADSSYSEEGYLVD